MTEKLVPNLDPQGYVIGAVVADPSPLEPGVYLIPGGAVDADFPIIPPGKRARWNGSGFDLEDVQQPEPEPTPTQEELQARAWDRIKAERDRRTESGGAMVDGRWFDTDAKSAIRYKYLADMAAAAGAADGTIIRAGWRPMDVATAGEINMTYGLLKQVMVAGIQQAMLIDDAAEAHKVAMMASADPSAYDYSSDWPPAFGDEA